MCMYSTPMVPAIGLLERDRAGRRGGPARSTPKNIEPSTVLSRSASVRPKCSRASCGQGGGGEVASGSIRAWRWPAWRYQKTSRTTPVWRRRSAAGPVRRGGRGHAVELAGELHAGEERPPGGVNRVGVVAPAAEHLIQDRAVLAEHQACSLGRRPSRLLLALAMRWTRTRKSGSGKWEHGRAVLGSLRIGWPRWPLLQVRY